VAAVILVRISTVNNQQFVYDVRVLVVQHGRHLQPTSILYGLCQHHCVYHYSKPFNGHIKTAVIAVIGILAVDGWWAVTFGTAMRGLPALSSLYQM